MTATVNASTSAGVIVTSDTSGALALQTAGTTALTISSAQQLTLASGTKILNSSGNPILQQTGSVLQVVTAETSTNTSTTSTSFVTTNLTASITPSSTSSKVFAIVSAQGFINGTGTSGIYTLFRGTVAGTNLGNSTWGFTNLYSSGGTMTGSLSINYLDSPSTTSSQTYTYAMRSESGSATHINANGQKAILTLMEIAA
jgi:hypothetical protein